MPENKATYISEEDEKRIVASIVEAEKSCSGEIRVHLEKTSKKDPQKRAESIFLELKMHKTALRNGVLIYVALDDHRFAIIGDEGINSKVPQGFWADVRDKMLVHFKIGDFTKGLCEGIALAGQQLATYFPYQKNDSNELPNEISRS